VDLVIQAPALGAPELARVASLAGAQKVEPLDGKGSRAFRLTRIKSESGSPITAAAPASTARSSRPISLATECASSPWTWTPR
jgi:hypothetical protein